MRQRTKVHAGSGGDRPASARLPATYVLIALNVLAFLAELASGSGGLCRSERQRGAATARLYGAAVAEGEWYRLVTGGLPPRRAAPHRLQHVRPLHRRARARAGHRDPALPRSLLRLAACRLVRSARLHQSVCAQPRRLGRDLRPLRRDRRDRPRPRHERARLPDRAPDRDQPCVHASAIPNISIGGAPRRPDRRRPLRGGDRAGRPREARASANPDGARRDGAGRRSSR